MKVTIAILAALVASASAITLQPPENQWARMGSTATLLCQSSEPLQSCTWVTPSGSTYTLGSGQQAEAGRLKHHVSGDAERDCGIQIEIVEEKDVGQWTCNVGVLLKDTEVVSATGKASLNIAIAPQTVTLTPFGDAAMESKNKQPVQCVVANADPRPVFTWYVGDEELVGYETEDAQTDAEGETPTWTQTLMYTPRSTHVNQTLRCVIEHVGLDEADRKEAAFSLSFTQDDVNAAKVAEENEEATGAMETILPIVGMVLVLLVFVSIIACVVLRRKRQGGKAQEEDVEAVVDGEQKEKDGENSQDESEKTDEEKNEGEEATQTSNQGFFYRIIDYFRSCKKAAAAPTEKDESSVEEGTKGTEEETSTETDGKEEKEAGEEKEKETEEDKKEEEEDKTEQSPATTLTARIWTFFKRRSAPAKKEDGEKEDATQEPTAESEKLKNEEEEKEKPVEYEPEEKEAKKEEEKTEEEKKEETQ